MEEEKKTKNYKTAMLVIITAFVTCMITTLSIYAIFLNGKQVGKYVLVTDIESSDEISAELSKYRTVIDKYFLGEIDEEKLKEGAIKGYIEGLNDPYTEFISKDEMKEYMEDTKGNFVGIGIYMTKNDKRNLIQVLSTIKGSPAEKIGIKAGDLIKSVDGVNYTSDDLDIISSKIKGEKGTKVKIELLRNEETLTFDVERDKVIVNQVEGKVIENDIGYIDIPSFDETTSQEFKTKFEELKSQNIKSLIIDLRNNGGGIVSEALKIADFITDKDSVLLYEVDKNNNETIQKSKDAPIVDIPVVLLVNENTASSSEILAGALKDLAKAKIVGTKTYGKGIIQQILTMPDGSGLKVTTEEYQTPNKNKIHKIGIEPDEKVELPEAVQNKLLVNEDEDTQLKKAIEILK